ncbi:GGDEF domain-containing protein [Pseudoalteromonas rhizosphaerae]|uniref:GGDEF domain-containing protein n=1 Tax=Pseudoalteromonas rhizosphaerae TaxID=2518973 RepID=UPI00384D9A25
MAFSSLDLLENEKQNIAYENRTRYVEIIAKALALGCILLSVLSLSGYVFSAPQLYRPIAGGSATHPLTAITIILIGFSVFLEHKKHFTILNPLLAITALLISLTVMSDILLSSKLAVHFTPFIDTVNVELQAGLSNSMGINTALMMAFLSSALLLGQLGNVLTAQLFAFIGLAVPMLSIIGYAYGITSFFGHMSILTTMYGMFLGGSVLCIHAKHGAVHALLSPHIGGRIARFQVGIGCIVPICIGYLFIQTLISVKLEDLFGLYVVVISWFIIVLIIFSAIIQEKIDEKRRDAELALIKAATYDSLTGIANRRHFMELAKSTLEQSALVASETYILMLDVDHFKSVNDRAGHAIGDKVLIAIASTLTNSVRKTDSVCRLGGEEFATILPKTSERDALLVAEKIRTAVEQTDIPGYTDIYGQVTISIGLAKAEDQQTIDAVLSHADNALYQAKESGRNKVAKFTDEDK